MGIRGLTTLIQEDARKLLPEHFLHDSTVVIDGNNLLHYLYHCCPALNAVFGGDYDRFYVYLMEFCELLAKCKIKPIIIFDGGLDKNNKKSSTRWKRFEQRIIASIKVSPANQHRMQVFPLLGKQVLLEVFQSQGIECRQCEYEADEEIAALARHLQCPVLSNDSDFYIYDVEFIPLESVELTPVVTETSGTVALRCTRFHLEQFLSLHGGMERTLLPLFATIMGNDYVQRSVFETLYSTMSWPRSSHMSETKKRLKAIMGWLKGQTVQGATEQMMTHVKKGDRPVVKKFVQQSIQTYTRKPYEHEESELLSYAGNALPTWFRQAYNKAQMPSWLLDIVCMHICPLHAVVEEYKLPNALLAGRPLLAYVSRVLWATDYPWLSNEERSGPVEDSSVSLTVRARKRSRLINDKRSLTAQVVSFPDWQKIPDLTLEERIKYLKTGLDVANVDLTALPAFLQFPVAVLLNCVQHSPVPLEAHYIDAFILAVIRMGIIHGQVGQLKSLQRIQNLLKEYADAPSVANEPTSQDLTVLLSRVTKLGCLKAAENLHKLFAVDELKTRGKKSSFERGVVHRWSQFQVCYLYASALNQILLCPLELTNIAKILNGTFLYNTTLTLRGNSQRRKLIGFWLYQGSVLDHFYCVLSDIIKDLVEKTCPGKIVEGNSATVAKNLRRKVEKIEDDLRNCEDSEADEEATEWSDTQESDDDALVGNRFAMLRIGKKR